MQHLSSLITLLAFAFVCTTASAQIASDKLLEEDLRLTQQKATITTFGEKGVVIELLTKDGKPREVELAGPYVVVYSAPGEGFQINDKNSASVAGVLGKDDVTFFGDLTLSSLEWSEQVPRSFQVHVYDALVELRTVWVLTPDSVNQIVQRQAVPLNQQGDFIRHMKEKAKKRRNL